MSALAERARVVMQGEWMAGMVDASGNRVIELDADALRYEGPQGGGWVARGLWALIHRAAPDLGDEVTVLALAALARKRLCEMPDTARRLAVREKLGQALRLWAMGTHALAFLAELVVEVLEAVAGQRGGA